MTSAILGILVSAIFFHAYYDSLLQILLVLDGVFIALHLIYRTLYAGPKLPYAKNGTYFLVVHVGSSLCALVVTFILLGDMNVPILLWASLTLWSISFASGAIFFVLKHYRRLP